MPKFIVYLVSTASTSVTVEAEDGEDAVEKAFQTSLPYAGAFAGFDLGDWTTPSDLMPQFNKPEDDYEEVRDA
jgi:hypothetical protein